jgi:putative FmdB family regulatory protein
MPTYLYQCPAHGEFEHQHSIMEELKDCPLCREENLVPQKVKRLIAAGCTFHLAGDCWSRDNYK